MRDIQSAWIYPVGDLCGQQAGDDLLELSPPEVPGGGAFIRRGRGCGLKRWWPRPENSRFPGNKVRMGKALRFKEGLCVAS